MNSPSSAPAAVLRDARGQPYEPAIGPRLRLLLALIFAAVALLGATAISLFAIRLFEWFRGHTYQNHFYQWMFIVHVLVGVLIILPFLAFGFIHLKTARHRKNRRAVRLGIALFLCGIIVCLTGVALVQLDVLPQLPTDTLA